MRRLSRPARPDLSRASRHRGKPRCYKQGGYARDNRGFVASSLRSRRISRENSNSPVASSLRSMTNAGDPCASPSPPRTPGPSRASRHRGKPRCYKQEGLRPGDRVFVASCLRSMRIPRENPQPRPGSLGLVPKEATIVAASNLDPKTAVPVLIPICRRHGLELVSGPSFSRGCAGRMGHRWSSACSHPWGHPLVGGKS